MKQIRQTSMTAVLVLALTATAFADGVMDTPVTTPPPPPPMPNAAEPIEDPETPVDGSSVLFTLTETTLSIMQNVLTLF
ncbi:MAG TPA: hypothetical protein VM934_17640 [Pyrinomonadaceae bacterium]|jgi:hypothetical protein|nr:hypothetical protein [Pyrinomonadaceae bacterium]